MSDMIRSWEIVPEAPKYRWGTQILQETSPDFVWEEPSDRMVSQLERIFHFLNSDRNWVVCFCQSPLYMRTIYAYLSAIWVYSTGTVASTVDLTDIVDMAIKNPEKLDELGRMDLLILPYGGAPAQALQRVRGRIASVLQYRRLHSKPTVMDIQVAHLPRGLDDVSEGLMVVEDIFGKVISDLLINGNTKYVAVQGGRSE